MENGLYRCIHHIIYQRLSSSLGRRFILQVQFLPFSRFQSSGVLPEKRKEQRLFRKDRRLFSPEQRPLVILVSFWYIIFLVLIHLSFCDFLRYDNIRLLFIPCHRKYSQSEYWKAVEYLYIEENASDWWDTRRYTSNIYHSYDKPLDIVCKN